MPNKLKTNSFAFVLWLILSCAVHIALFRAKVNADYQIWQRILWMLLAIFLTLPTHELIHFVFMKLFCMAKVEIKIAKTPLGLPSLVTVAHAEFRKWQLIIIYLAPFVCLTLIVDIVLGFCARVELVWFLVPTCNCAGCFFDLVDTLSAAKKK